MLIPPHLNHTRIGAHTHFFSSFNWLLCICERHDCVSIYWRIQNRLANLFIIRENKKSLEVFASNVDWNFGIFGDKKKYIYI